MRTATELKADVLKISQSKFISKKLLECQFHFSLRHVFMKVQNDKHILSLANVILIVYHSIENEAWVK